MGFFKNLVNAVKEVAKPVVKKIKETFTAIVEKISGKNKEFADKVGNKATYSQRVEVVVDYVSMISEYIHSIQPHAKEMEELCIEEFISYFNDIIEPMEENYKHERDQIIAELNRNKESLKGTMKHYINKKVSIDNVELMSIFKMSKGASKNKKLDEFQKQVLSDARTKLCLEIQKKVQLQNNFIQKLFDNIAEKMNKRNEAAIDNLNKFNATLLSDEKAKKEAILQISNLIVKSDYFINKL